MWPGDALPQHGNANWKFFYASGTDWQTYMKPPGASMIYIMMLASGAGGSRVADGSVTTAGGGGGSGGMSRMLIPAFLLPDIIYVQPGVGGIGATTANTVGGAGATSYVSTSPSSTTANLIFSQDGAASPATTQAGGVGSVVGSVSNTAFSSLGLWFSVAGQTGGGGSSALNGNATSVSPNSPSVMTTAGAGGANGTGTPGAISASGFFQGTTTTAGVAEQGFRKGQIISPGLKSYPLFFTGGTGGSGVSTAATAGSGGDGSYGGGGGGGGSGTNAGSVSGNGGNGGDGLIIIGTL